MGIKGLWTLLGPHCERIPLYQIHGETVAVDLSGWVCDSQHVADNHAQPRLYLRNLYFRTSYLLLQDITPVFVLEGEAPSLKKDTMAARNLLQYKENNKNNKESNKENTKKPDGKRRRFAAVLRHCQDLLSSMGAQCVKGEGEAEAMCAHLNAQGLVSAVISQDSDCFAYGAMRVYRNFSVSSSGCSAANSGSVDVYDLRKIQQTVDIGRNKMVALALLCGCDYNAGGVEGVGYSNAVSFLMQQPDSTVLDRLESWVFHPAKYIAMSKKANDPSVCTGCGHHGNIRAHNKLGCLTCCTDKGCHTEKYKGQRQHMKTELMLRGRVLKSPGDFPDHQLIQEFLTNKEKTPQDFNTSWTRPDLIKFTKIMVHWLGWTESYCVEKFLPLLTGWQLRNHQHKDCLALQPDFIKKKKTPKGVPCYEVVWKDPEKLYERLISDDQYETAEDLQNLWTTVEKQDLMEAAYPEVVQAYLLSKQKPKKPKKVTEKKTKTKKTTGKVDVSLELNISMKNLSLKDVTNKKKKVKRKGSAANASFKTKRKYKKRESSVKQKKIVAYLKSKKDTSKLECSVKTSVYNFCSSPFLRRKSHLFDSVNITAEMIKNLNFEASDDDFSDMSDIIDDIVRRNDVAECDFDSPVLRKFRNSIKSPVFDVINNFSTPIKSLRVNSLKDESRKSRRLSYFFSLDEQNDAFENSIYLKNAPENNEDSSEDTIDNIFEDKSTNLNSQSPNIPEETFENGKLPKDFILESKMKFDSNLESKDNKENFNATNSPERILKLEQRLFGRFD